MNASHEGKARLSPSTAAAIAAGVASAAACGLSILAGNLASGSIVVPAAVVVLASLLVAAVTRAIARRAIRAELAAISQGITRLEAQDFATPAAPSSQDTRELVAALESCRAALGERHGVAKAHAAVARLLCNAVHRLAEGDLAARITVDLPEPYRRFRDDFNGSMEALDAAFGGLAKTGGHLSGRAREIAEAADALSRRAAKLAERLDADMWAIDAGASRDPAEMLRIARHTLGGAAIAARRNGEAAAQFTALGRGLAREAERLFILAGVEPPRSTAAADPVESPNPPAAGFPASLGATALKLHR